MNAIELSLFSSRMNAICEEMGLILQRAAFSPNIIDRLDFSCAIFDAAGELIAQAAHIPVHLGSMAYAMSTIVEQINWQPGDMYILNDPYRGGTHLPDVTVISPLFIENQCAAFIANRAHHADIGADAPGSMPVAGHLQEEGLLIKPTRLLKNDRIIEQVMRSLTRQMRNPTHAEGDFTAQVSANRAGLQRLGDLIVSMGLAQFRVACQCLDKYARQLAKQALAGMQPGTYAATDFMDDDGQGNQDIRIHVAVTVTPDKLTLDFSGSSGQVAGNINCPLSVTAAAAYYVFRCLLPSYTPLCQGSFRLLKIEAPPGSLLNAQYPAAVAAGNVETSSRIVDVILAALAPALPDRIPAASHGSMNNLAMGADDTEHPWDYYETMGGGMGASSRGDGVSAIQTHMTNTLNTPIEIIESHFPLRVRRYAIRKHSGGEGYHRGGDGMIREFEFLQAARVTLLTERRNHPPPGLNGGGDGKVGMNYLNEQQLSAKASIDVKAGDILSIQTPGGGGWGQVAS